jgi:hypothetical protein
MSRDSGDFIEHLFVFYQRKIIITNMYNDYDDDYGEDTSWDADEEFLEEEKAYDELPPTGFFRVRDPPWVAPEDQVTPWFVFTFPSPGCMIAIILAFVVGLAVFLVLVARDWSPPAEQAAAVQAPAEVAEVLSDATVEEDTTDFVASPEAAVAPCEVSDLFPKKVLRWCNLISFYAKHQSLDPDLVAALVWLESGGNEVAYSRSGAVGLMQVMPQDGLAATFMCVNGPCFGDRPTIAELQNPEFNIKYGTRMLARLLNKHGDVREALKSYGPMNVGYYYADKVLGLLNQYGKTP